MQYNRDKDGQAISQYARSIIDRARVARLATVDSQNRPHIVPVVFAFDSIYYYIPLDKKTKKNKPEKLKRVRNIQQNPNVALLIDEYDEDWKNLSFVMISGEASLIDDKGLYKELLKKAQRLLCQKYLQYQMIGIGNSCIMISPEKIVSWKNEGVRCLWIFPKNCKDL